MDKLREEFEAWALTWNYSLARFSEQHQSYASTATNAAWHAYQAASASRGELEWVVNGFLEWHEGNPCPDGLFDRARAVLSKEQQ